MNDTSEGGFAEWLKDNPEPSLQKLAETYGGVSRVPKQAWAEYDAAKKDWEQRYRLRHTER